MILPQIVVIIYYYSAAIERVKSSRRTHALHSTKDLAASVASQAPQVKRLRGEWGTTREAASAA